MARSLMVLLCMQMNESPQWREGGDAKVGAILEDVSVLSKLPILIANFSPRRFWLTDWDWNRCATIQFSSRKVESSGTQSLLYFTHTPPMECKSRRRRAVGLVIGSKFPTSRICKLKNNIAIGCAIWTLCVVLLSLLAWMAVWLPSHHHPNNESEAAVMQLCTMGMQL